MKKIYVNVGTQVAELLGIDSRNEGGKYRVLIKGQTEPTNVSEVGTRISQTLYNEYQPTKQPAKRSKKS